VPCSRIINNIHMAGLADILAATQRKVEKSISTADLAQLEQQAGSHNPRELEVAGAAALSVLTDDEYFQGSLENLRIASSETRLPCQRKDFIIDEFQILEARANCADAVLLIVAALAQAEVISLAKRAKEFQLDVLCEVHDEEELGRALDAGCDLVGVNSRDLQTLKVDL